MLRLSKLTDYAVVVLVRLGGSEGVQTSTGIAAATGIPEPTVAKVLKTLAASDLVASQRGARGGYRLNRSLAAIPIADVIAAVDGPIALDRLRRGIAVADVNLRVCVRCVGDGIPSTRPFTQRCPTSHWPTCRSHCYLRFASRTPRPPYRLRPRLPPFNRLPNRIPYGCCH